MDPNQIIREVMAATFCGDIFERNEAKIKEKYREYAKIIHPDRCKENLAEAAFQRLSKLYATALKDLQTGTWRQSGKLWLNSQEAVDYRTEKVFELGTRYTGDNRLVWAFDKGKEIWADRCFQKSKVSFSDTRMKNTYQSRIPRIEKAITIEDGRQAVIFAKEADEYPMDLFLSGYGRDLGGRDIAWMISRMVDLCCFLYVCGIVHNGISVETLFINVDKHSMHLYGGWQYATGIGEKMTGTTKEIYQLMPTSARTTGLATPITDMECVRDLFRTIYKDIRMKTIPKEILRWIDAGSLENPIQEYERWNLALDQAYGMRKFQVFSADADKIYSRH